MKAKNAFTLIELLAVIVILAIIALIATPLILNIISDAKEESNKRSVEMYANAVEQAVAKQQLTLEISNGRYVATNDGKTLTKQNDSTKVITVDYNGKVDCEVIMITEKGTIYLNKCKVDGQETEYESKNKVYYDGESVYFNVTIGQKCDYNQYNNNTDNEGKTGCLKFYAFLDDGGETIDLLLDHNTTTTVAWNSNIGWASVKEQGPLTLLSQLESDTSSWQGLETPKNYTYKQNGIICEDANNCTPGVIEYVIDYTGYKARIITAEEIAEITGNSEWTVGSSWYYFQDLTQNESTGRGDNCKDLEGGCTYKWLYDKTRTNCTNYGCASNIKDSLNETEGYWTVSSRMFGTSHAWLVYRKGFVGSFENLYVDIDYGVGLRPVITVSKSKFS